MQLTITNIQYHPATGAVALYAEHPFGAFFLCTTEDALQARVAVEGNVWGNPEAEAEGQYLVSTCELFVATTGMSAERYPPEGFTVQYRAVCPERDD